MKYFNKLKRRYYKTTIVKLFEPEASLCLQLGWVEKFHGVYILTDSGEEALRAGIHILKERNGR